MKFARIYVKPYGAVFFDFPLIGEATVGHVFSAACREGALVQQAYVVPKESIHYIMQVEFADVQPAQPREETAIPYVVPGYQMKN